MASACANFSSEANSCSPLRNVKPTKKMRFYRNGDSFFDGLSFAVGDRFRTFESLMTALTNSTQLGDNRVLPKGVRYIYTMDGRKVTNLDELQDGESYVVSSVDAFKKINYAKTSSPNWNPSMRGGAMHKRIEDDFSKKRELDVTEALSKELTDISLQKGRVFVIVRNGIKPRKIARILLNSRLAHSFDQVLDMIGMSFQTPPVKKLFTFDRKQITSLAELMQGPDTTILAFGNEKKADTDFMLTDYELQSLRAVKSNFSVTPPNEASRQNFSSCTRRSLTNIARSASAPGTPKLTRRNDTNGDEAAIAQDSESNGQAIGQLSLFSTPLATDGAALNGNGNGNGNGKHSESVNGEQPHGDDELF